ncbi:MAG: ribonuclease G, partial [Coriobacteriaceae bacterium]|nr:ribonuclease G [Coriobacteriaceae bacterium]
MGERYTVTFVSEDDAGTQSVIKQLFDISAGQAIGTLPEAPFHAGQHFTKWIDQDTGAQITEDTIVESDITAVAQFDTIQVFQVTVEHWYTNPNTGEEVVFNRTIVEMEKADAPLSVDSPVSTKVEGDDDTTNPIYIPTQTSIEITADDLEHATVRDGKGYLTKRVEFVP